MTFRIELVLKTIILASLCTNLRADNSELINVANTEIYNTVNNEINNKTTPKLITPFRANYPSLSKLNGEQGKTILEVLVNKEGLVTEFPKIIESSGYQRLDDAAIETVMKAKFYPAQQGSEPVEASIHVPIIFKIFSQQ